MKIEVTMKKIALILLSVIFAPIVFAASQDSSVVQNANTDTLRLKTFKDSLSYAVGVDIANNITTMGFDVDRDMMWQGFTDALNADRILLSQDEIRTVFQAMSMVLRKKQQEEQQKQAKENMEKGLAFLAANQKEEGVISTPSGIQYMILRSAPEGQGEKVAAGDRVSVHYVGYSLDGKEFDSSYKRGKPAEFSPDAVIPGWQKVLKMMQVGEKWRVWIPASLAYGSRGAGDKIGPNEVLMFEIELISVIKKRATSE
jgi:FKBP-type peptidyl-prolyl cis-trans isomerase